MGENSHFIKDIEITKFKCFNSFKAGAFKRVNLIGGKNNIGKTAFMEAIYLYTSTSMTMAYQRLLTLRTYRDMQEMFVSNDTDESILKSLILENQDINIGTEKKWNYIQESNADAGHQYMSKNILKIEKNENSGLFTFRSKDEGINIDEGINFIQTSEDGDFDQDSYYRASSHEYSLSKLVDFLHSNMPDTKYSTSKIFIGTNLNDNNLLEKIIGDLKLNNKYDSFNNHLSRLFNINNIDFINKKPMAKIDDKHHSLTTLGEGIKSIIFYLGSLLTLKHKYLFIDEIENGIHYSKLDDIWELILTISKEQNVQVFATTHSKECIESYHRIIKKLEDKGISFIELGKNKEHILKAYVMDFEQFDKNIKIGNGVRGW